jgi:hypothetical protein
LTSANLVWAKQAYERVLQVGNALAADQRLPLLSQLVEHRLPIAHERMPSIGHRQACPPPVARVATAFDVSVLFQKRDGLCCGLLRHRRASAHL